MSRLVARSPRALLVRVEGTSAESSTPRTPMKNAIKQYVMVARTGDLEPGTGKTVEVNGMPVALFNVNGVYHAIHNTCPPEDSPLGEGELSHNIVTCPWHAYEFDVTSGLCLTEPAYSVERFEVRVEGDRILVSGDTVQPEARGTADR